MSTGIHAPVAGNVTSVLSAVDLTAFSKEVLWNAEPLTYLKQFAVPRTELDAQPGSRIQFLKYNQMRYGHQLTEQVDLTATDISAATSTIEVKEWGNAVGITETLLHQSPYDVLGAVSKMLADDYARLVDLSFIHSLLYTPLNAWAPAGTQLRAGGAANNAALTAADTMSAADLRNVQESKRTRKVPKILTRSPFGNTVDASYVGVVHPHVERSLMEDSDWKNASLYAGSTQIFNGESGKYHDIRISSTTMMVKVLVNGQIEIDGVNMSVASATVPAELAAMFTAVPAGPDRPTVPMYVSFFFGDYTTAWVETMGVQLRDNGVQNFGRRHELAWLSYFGAGVINPNRVTVYFTA
jgi:N4-gp56 family major capsid protein